MLPGRAVPGDDFGEGLAVAVQAHHRAVGSPLEPADQQLVEVLIRRHAAVEAADVRGPPGDARNAHVQPGAHLHAQEFPGAADVAAPHQRAVALAPGPGAAHQIHGILHALGLHALIEAPGEGLGIHVARLHHRAHAVAVVAVIVGAVLRLRLVQPEHAHTLVPVILPALVPHILPGPGIGGVEEHAVPAEAHAHLLAVLAAHQ